jgi:hypothetical protein
LTHQLDGTSLSVCLVDSPEFCWLFSHRHWIQSRLTFSFFSPITTIKVVFFSCSAPKNCLMTRRMMNHLPTIFYFYSASCCCCLRDFQLDIAQGKNVQLLRGCWCRLNVCVCRFLPFSSEFVYRRGWKSERWA